jgi:DNA replication protein DnaC
MLHHPTLDKLQQLRLTAMATALQEQSAIPDIHTLGFEERLGLLVDRELTAREERRLQTRLRQAKLKHSACLEDLDATTPRGLDRALLTQLATGQWIREGLNCLILGPTDSAT